MNNCAFVGRVGKDAVVRRTQSGKAVTGFSLAVTRGYGENKQTIWLDCSAWGDRYEKTAAYMLKGTQLGVVGEIGTREHDGKTYVTLDVREVTLLGGGKAAQATGGSDATTQAPSRGAVDDFGDPDIPFITCDSIY